MKFDKEASQTRALLWRKQRHIARLAQVPR